MFISDTSSKIFNSAREYYQNKIIKLDLFDKIVCHSFNPFEKNNSKKLTDGNEYLNIMNSLYSIN